MLMKQKFTCQPKIGLIAENQVSKAIGRLIPAKAKPRISIKQALYFEKGAFGLICNPT